MQAKKRFSPDKKVNLLSMQEFMEKHDYCLDAPKHKFPVKSKYKMNEDYYKITHDLVIFLSFGLNWSNFEPKLEFIDVAYRNGKSEYDLLNNKIEECKTYLATHRKCKKWASIQESIPMYEKVIKLLEKAKAPKPYPKKEFKDYLIDTGYKTEKDNLKNKFLVFDVETNGLRSKVDDLLSISIYDPDSGMAYNRFFPLQMQPVILTYFINGITDKDLASQSHMTQQEFDEIIEYFDAENKTWLSFSGGEGLFDFKFFSNYLSRQKIKGFENLKFDNIKKYVPDAGPFVKDYKSKDNLCLMLGIDGVQEVHTAYNDCLLEWKLFEKLKTEKYFFKNQVLYRFNDGYIAPITAILNSMALRKFVNSSIPTVTGSTEEIFTYHFPEKAIKKIKKFPTNITGISFESALNSKLNVFKNDNFQFLNLNNRKLEFVYKLDSNLIEIPIIDNEDGTFTAENEKDSLYVKMINDTNEVIMKNLEPVVNFIKGNIFHDEKIQSQEINFSNDNKIFAISDLSSNSSILEIKTANLPVINGVLNDRFALQLYYQSKLRNTYLLHAEFKTDLNSRGEIRLNDLIIHIYKVILHASNFTNKYLRRLSFMEKTLLGTIINHPKSSKKELSEFSHMSCGSVNKNMKYLKSLGYVDSVKEKNVERWFALRSLEDDTTELDPDDPLINHPY